MRPIDADALWMDIIRSMDYCEDILEIIERQPTIEPERKKGKWMKYDGDFDYDVKCSECECPNDYETDFCPHCGSFNGGDKDEAD